MAQAVAAVAAIAASEAVGAYVSVLTGSAFLTAAAQIGTIAVVSGTLGERLAPKPSFDPIETSAAERKQMIRQAITAWETVYGEVKKSGAITFVHQTDNNTYFNLILTVAAHECQEIGEIYFNDEPAVEADGTVVAKYAGYVEVWKGLGTTAGDSALHAAAQANCPGKWTANHKQTGHAKLYIRFKRNTDIFPSGIPNVSMWIKGKKLYDPRTGTTVWSENPALAIRDYLLNTETGVGATSAEVDDALVQTAANICEEQVAVVNASQTFTADAGTDLLTLAAQLKGLRTGNGVQVSTTGTLPGGLAPATTYYWIRYSDTKGKLATSYANAIAGTAINITSAGSGTHTLTRKSEARYTCHGTVSSNTKPGDVLESLKSALAGRLVYIGGKWRLYAGAWRTPTLTLDEDDLDGPIRVQARISRRELCNRVKGVFVDPDKSWQPDSFPPVKNATYLAEDNNEEIWKEINLAFTISPSTAQRIAKQELEATRQQMTTWWPCKLTAFPAQACEVVYLNNTRWGWTNKPFEVSEFRFAIRGDRDAPRLGCDLTLRETASGVYDWASGEETTVDLAPNTDLPDPSVVAAPTGLTLASGTAQLDKRLDGTIFSRIKASWTAPADAFVTSAGTIEIQYKKSADSAWQSAPPVPGDQTVAYILDVQDGVAYDVRLRSANRFGAKSAWVTSSNHTVLGKSQKPADVTGFSAVQNGTRVNFRCDPNAETDNDRIEVRRTPAGVTDWSAGVATANILRGNAMVSEVVPPGAWTFLAKAFDTTFNESANAARYDLTVTNPNTVVIEKPQAPDWLGTLTNCEKHWTGVLVPSSTKTAAQHTREELFEQFVPYPPSEYSYEAPEIDIGFDATFRLHAVMSAALGRGVASGVAVPALEIDYKLAAGAYDGFEAWTVGDITARYVKLRVKCRSATGKAYISAFTPTGDKAVTRECIAEGLSVAAGGTAVTFSPRYFQTPTVEVQPVGATARLGQPDAVTATGCTARLFDPTTGAGASGTADVYATGARA